MPLDPSVAELTRFSLVVAGTERGKEIVEAAMRAGYLKLKPAEHWKLVKSQQGLLDKKGSVWGRRLALRLLGLPITRLPGLDLFHCWRTLSWTARFRPSSALFAASCSAGFTAVCDSILRARGR